ncbi:SHD1 domain-containing protein [Blastopirellula marina]|uniref:SLA1 homology domain-containing protein n=1 Tax=Blastopirellula marina DSM 3645 TaxID=314230 RepID=A4A0K4_9BACT|nr:SHD1 domain-containing protein [Blastopirellula marina]EAQ77660.1 hypothetical protein DSM3645_01796 [Blastopirellula marina DSM 3645]
MSGRIKFAICLATLILSSVYSQAHARIWIDSEGRSVDAEFVKYDADGDVTLRRTDNGKTITVAFSKFSEADQRRIEKLRDESGKTEGNPFAADPIKPDSFEANPFSADSSAPESDGMQDNKQELLPGEKGASEAEARRELMGTRKWTDDQGNQIKAKFVRIFEGNVILLQGNKAQSVDFYKLSAMDQKFLHAQMEILGDEDQLPPIIIHSRPDDSSAIAASPFPRNNWPAGSESGGTGPSGMGPGRMGPSGMNSAPTPPKNNFEAERDRLAREFEEKFAKSSVPAAQPVSREPEKIASHTPAYDPWANQSPSRGSTRSSPAPPKVTPPPPTVRPPSPPSRWPTSPSGRKPPMSGSPLGGDMVWECQTCHTQFDTVKKPSACYFCWSLRIGAFVLISVVGAAIRGAMS